MDKTSEQIAAENQRQYSALISLNDEVMSMLHAQQLRHEFVNSKQVVEWLRVIFDEVQQGLGNPKQFGSA